MQEKSPAVGAGTAKIFHIHVILFSVFLLPLETSAAGVASDTLNNGGNLTDGSTLVSAGGSFTLGFFSPGSPSKRYLGIWFSNSTSAVVWVANRDSPLNDTAGVLVISGATGELLLLDGFGQAAWSSNTTTGAGPPPSEAQLLESGNLVVRGRSSGDVLWQSFDHPSNTLIAGMRLGRNPRTGDEWSLTSWRSRSDPTTGDYRNGMGPGGLPAIVTWRGAAKKYRSGPWNGAWFNGVPEMTSYSSMYTNRLVDKPDEVAFVFDDAAAGVPFCRLVLNEAGVVQSLVWDQATQAWNALAQSPRDVCDDYAKCGAFGLCNVNTATTLFCSCMAGFTPASPSRWSMRETSGGCRRSTPLECGGGDGGAGTTTDGFVAVRGVKLPDTDNATVDMGATLEGCRARCLANCSCLAYAAADIRGGGAGSGCLMWTGGIIDARNVDKGQDLYLRLAKSELGHTSEVNKKSRYVLKVVIPIIAFLLILTCIYLVRTCQTKGKQKSNEYQKKAVLRSFRNSHELFERNIEFPFLNFEDVVASTNNFSDSNMLGKGGFGKVYKGMLGGGKEVAVKRLSTGSTQGVEHFTNEVVLIAKLQHKNLVRLLGCCIHGDEKLLVYEYLPNKSLDYFLFDDSKKSMLDWQTRFNIIKGVARGLVYLHQDSRMTIIHRDLKASNILLDEKMRPKISDFGMARIFGGSEQQESTKRVVGTYGYMSPEYAMEGIFSVKSDTYSFGILLLEIVSGLKISSPHHLVMDFPNLIAYAWNLWKDEKQRDFVDTLVIDNCSLSEVFRCIHIGLLCVQDSPNARPLMSSVASMLDNEGVPCPVPNQPIYFVQRHHEAEEQGKYLEKSVNNVTLTMLEGR